MSYDVAVVGAGLIGTAIAREASRAGRRVVVVDRDPPCRHASWAAAGMLSPQAESHQAGPFLDLLLRARDAYRALVPELETETGIGLGYRTEGTLLVAFGDAEDAELLARASWQGEQGLPVERLSGAEVRRLEPSLAPGITSGLRFEGDHQIDNRLLGKAYWFSAAAAGAEFRTGSGVRRIDPEGHRLVLHGGESIEADQLVIAAGSWSGHLEGLQRALPVEPVHGQLISIESAPPLLRHVTGSLRGYLVPRADGRLIAGTTVERVGHQTRVTPAGLRRITDLAIEMLPGAADRPLAASWSGLRPGTPDRLPILGRDPDHPHLVYATGHFRNGILLAPLTGSLIAALIDGGSAGVDLHPFRVDRF